MAKCEAAYDLEGTDLAKTIGIAGTYRAASTRAAEAFFVARICDILIMSQALADSRAPMQIIDMRVRA